MIDRTLSYRVKTTDGEKFFSTLEEAQKWELSRVLVLNDEETTNAVAILVMKNREKVLDILTTTPTGKPRGRKINGATRKRKKEEIVYGGEQPKAA